MSAEPEIPKAMTPEEPAEIKNVTECFRSVFRNEHRELEGSKTEPLPQLFSDTAYNMCHVIPEELHEDMTPFWEGYSEQFAEAGIVLCELVHYRTWGLPTCPAEPAPSPFANFCVHEQQDDSLRYARYLQPGLAYAQDAKRRDLVIKMTDIGSMEYQIYCRLAECRSLYDSHTYPNVLPPTAILDSPYAFAFVAMPMWSIRIGMKGLDTVGQVMQFMHCTLAGLTLLHRLRIAHRDISESNTLINWYCCQCEHLTDRHCDERLREHRRSPNAVYALFDFDLSLILPLDASLTDCRRPGAEAFMGQGIYHPPDVFQGERYYNPFPFDVGCLGNLYLNWLSRAIPVVPLLAPLLGKMTTHVVRDRFTAEEALAFFTQIRASLPPEIIDVPIEHDADFDCIMDPDRYWSQLPLEFQSRWKTHRPPPLHWFPRFLRWMCGSVTGYAMVARVRRCLKI